MKKLFLIGLLAGPLAVWGQETAPALEKNLYTLGILPLAGVWERQLTGNHSLRTQLGAAGSFWINGSSNNGTFFNYQVRPYAAVGYRYYYNLAKRQQKGKNTAFNSGNFVSLFSSYTRWGFGRENIPLTDDYRDISAELRTGVLTTGVMWGLQRTYRRKFNLNLGLGAGVEVTARGASLTPVADLGLGYVLNRRNE